MSAPYYVYALFRQDGSPFYIGMGKGDRWISHERRATKRETHKDRLICSMISAGYELPKVKIREQLTKAEAVLMEIALISAIGREPSGPLINQTAGGDGVVDLPEETRRRAAAKTSATLKGRRRDPETIAKITATKRAKAALDRAQKPPPVPKAPVKRIRSQRNIDAVSQFWSDPERSADARRRLAAAQRGRIRSDETRAKISAVQIGRKAKIETREKMKVSARARVDSLSAEDRSEIVRKGWATRRGRHARQEN